MKKKTVVLCILDGWGYRKGGADNAIHLAHTPVYDSLLKTAPFCVLQASEASVGLPAGQMGNSEVGHTNMGAGRIVLQNFPRISKACREDAVADSPALEALIVHLLHTKRPCHLMGLLSSGGVHSHVDHLVHLAQILDKRGVETIIHGFTDGRDCPPTAGAREVGHFVAQIARLPHVMLGTVMGRYWAMDRDNRWERIEKAFHAIVASKGEGIVDFEQAIAAQYASGITDEFLPPLIHKDYIGRGVDAGDGLLMANFRSDRARQLLQAFMDPQFEAFSRPPHFPLVCGAGMVSYAATLDPFLPALFPSLPLSQTLGEVIATQGGTQLRLAETEKYPHVTFFLNGGAEAPFSGEDRILVPSQKVATYDLKPEMAAHEVTQNLCHAIDSGAYDLIVVNYANADMVGHTGDLPATIKAIETLDQCLGQFLACLHHAKGQAIITADHGNADSMRQEAPLNASVDASEEDCPSSNGQGSNGERLTQSESAARSVPHTAHTLSPVPCILIMPHNSLILNPDGGALCDVAPTILTLLGLPIPVEMTGKSLLQ